MSKQDTEHGDFYRDAEPVTMGSEQSFGFVFGVLLTIIGGWPLLRGAEPRWWSLSLAVGFLFASLLRPSLLRALNVLWFKLGMALNMIVNPVIMGLLFYLTITPIALSMRVFGQDPLSLKRDGEHRTYWIHRDPPGPTGESMKNQF